MSVVFFKPKAIDMKVVKQEPKHKIFERAIERFIQSHIGITEWGRDDIKKLIYLDIKYIEAIHRSDRNDDEIGFLKKSPMEQFSIMDAVVNIIGLLKPMELLEIFPVDKTYDGDKYQTKDYYYTMEALSKLNQDEPIGKEAFALLWDYQNQTITLFMVQLISVMNVVGMYQGLPDALDVILNNAGKTEESRKDKFTIIHGGLS